MTQLENKVPLDQNGITARLSDQHLLVENLKTANIFDTGSIYIQVSIIFLFDNLHISSGKLAKIHLDIFRP